jgi:formylglycine-generating enzyme required for sulfatase activity
MSSTETTLQTANAGLLPGFIRVPSHPFIMGTDEEQVQHLLWKEDWARDWYEKNLFLAEQPQHTVRLPEFAIAAKPLTNAEYRPFVWETHHRAPRHWLGFYPPDGLDDHPVTGISWTDAQAFCAWMSNKLSVPVRLPTEAEWERAARGTDGRLYPWGQEFDPWRCNTLESGKAGTTPVGFYSPSGDSPLGCHDMAGNVWEWTSSLLRSYPYQPTDGRENEKAHGQRVVRGGSWYYTRKLARCAAREGVLPTYLSPALGFRLAYTP